MGRKRENLTGQKFGRLTVISLNEEVSKQKKGVHWNCKCDCGNEKVISGSNLRRGRTTSCGCLIKERAIEVANRKRLDLTGQRFGRLTVISLNEEVSKQKGRSHWNCKCDCGNEKVVCGSSLTKGVTISCGCYNREKTKEMWQDEESRRIQSKRLKEQWQDEEFRQMQSELSSKRLKEQWQDEDYRQMKSNKMREMVKEKWQDEDYRQMQSNKAKKQMREKWQDEEFRQMHRNIHSKMSGENSPTWKGGITPIKEHLGGLPVVKQWRKDTYSRENNKCQLTGKKVHGGNSDVHHLYGFNIIVLEAHELYNIQVKPQVKDYTEEELHKLEEYVTSWHKDTSNAVLLSKEVHILFHKKYGYGDNTPEQFKEFRERYIAGEFEGLI